MACKSSKISKYLNYTIKVTTVDGREFIGRFIAFDKYMNLVLSETEERRTIRDKRTHEEKEIKRHLGLMILRGDCVLGYTALSAPFSKAPQQFTPTATVVQSGTITAGPRTNPSLATQPRGVGVGIPTQPSMGTYSGVPPMYGGVIPPGMIPPGMVPPPGMIPPGMAPPPGMVPPGMMPDQQAGGMPNLQQMNQNPSDHYETRHSPQP
ncbi:Sm protein B [Entamoeba marina]